MIGYPKADDLTGGPGDAQRRSAGATWVFERIFLYLDF